MTELPLAPFKRIVKSAGADRVSEDAMAELRDEVEQYAKDRARESNMLADHAGRVTVQAEDVRNSQ